MYVHDLYIKRFCSKGPRGMQSVIAGRHRHWQPDACSHEHVLKVPGRIRSGPR